MNHVSVSIEEGEIVGLIGPNGAGKTTFLNCVAGALKPSGGRGAVCRRRNHWRPARGDANKGMSRTFQIPIPFPKLTVLENVMVGAVFGAKHLHGKTARRAGQALEVVRFPLPLDTPAERLNTVQLKRLDLARALACSPKILLLDELASGLTPGELDDMMDLIRKVRGDGITIIIVEHIMQVIQGICDRVFVLQYGTKIAEGTTTDVLRNPVVIEAYLGTSELGF